MQVLPPRDAEPKVKVRSRLIYKMLWILRGRKSKVSSQTKSVLKIPLTHWQQSTTGLWTKTEHWNGPLSYNKNDRIRRFRKSTLVDNSKPRQRIESKNWNKSFFHFAITCKHSKTIPRETISWDSPLPMYTRKIRTSRRAYLYFIIMTATPHHN